MTITEFDALTSSPRHGFPVANPVRFIVAAGRWHDPAADRVPRVDGESDVHFACVCLRASIGYAIEAAFWCTKAKR